MIYSLWFRRYAPFSEFGFGFEGDHRTTASTSMSATARTIGGVSFGPGIVGSGLSSSSGSSYTGLGSSFAGWGGRHMSHVTSSVSVTTRTISAIRFTTSTAGANPMIPGAPDIDTYVNLSVTFRTNELVFDGNVCGDDFPNAEVFVYDGVGNSVLLFDFVTSRGQNTGPMTGLAGAHETNTLGSFFARIPIRPSGAFALPAGAL